MKTDMKLDPEEIKKRVISEAILHPLTLFPSGAVILGGLGFALFGSPIAAMAAIGGGVIASSSWAVNYFARKNFFTDQYIKELQKKIQDERKAMLVNLREDLIYATQDNIEEDFSHQAIAQLDLSQSSFENFIEILDQKLNRGEITYSRFLVSAEQTYLSIVDNLQKVATIFKGVKMIDPKEMEKQLKSFSKRDGNDIAKTQIMERKNMLGSTLKDIDAILTENETAITSLQKATITLSKTTTKKGQSEYSNVNEALEELEEMISRTHKYSVD